MCVLTAVRFVCLGIDVSLVCVPHVCIMLSSLTTKQDLANPWSIYVALLVLFFKIWILQGELIIEIWVERLSRKEFIVYKTFNSSRRVFMLQ